MRARFLLSALVLGVGLAGAVATQASAAAQHGSPQPGASAMPGMDMTMPGMDMPSAAPPKPSDRAANIQRARLKPVFLEAKLNGSNEVPLPGKPPVGDPKGSATGIVRVRGDRITFAFSWTGISAPTLGHIHQGVAGVNGDVKVPLFATPMPETATAAAGVLTVSDPAIADALRANPSGFYLNLHTKEFPGGAVRGQLTRLDHPVDVLGLLKETGSGKATEKAFLSGDQEVPVAGGPAVGDPTGRAVAFINAHGTEVNYAFAWLGIAPTLGHIHKAPFGVNGPVVVPLFASPVPSTIVAIAGTVTGVDATLVNDINTHPAGFYTNLHTAQFPGGAVRGQLFGRR
jgi:CHRD domain